MKHYRYKYSVNFIGDDTEDAYEAFIPKFPKIHAMGDTLEELNEGVMVGIESEIEDRKKKGLPIPPEDKKPTRLNGKILLRVDPELHEKLLLEASRTGLSLNKYLNEKLSKSV